MSIRVLLSDDESLARERLRCLLQDEADLEIVAECGDGNSAIALIKKEKPDLVFLDVQMPEVDGFGVVSALQRDHLPLTIFVTAYDRYAMKAFEVHALDYLLKPVGKERLGEALDHARKQLTHPSETMFQRRVLDMLADLEARQKSPDRIVVKSDGEIVCLKPQEIDWAESAGNYVCLHVGAATHILRETITALEGRLGRQFLRVHRSTLVNVDRIKTLRPSLYGDYAILLRDGTKLTLSRGFRETVLRRLGRPNSRPETPPAWLDLGWASHHTQARRHFPVAMVAAGCVAFRAPWVVPGFPSACSNCWAISSTRLASFIRISPTVAEPASASLHLFSSIASRTAGIVFTP